jgi:DNA invertase Pin-like site-specific DNA recombinase
MMMASSEKIGPEHLARPAVVYVRQSTVSQVRHHHESRRRQYDLAARAKQLGWCEVSVIDEDLGRSGASSAARTGFKHLVAEVGLGRIGAIFAIEVSRFARNNRDWYQLLDLCGLMDTLIIDDEGIYNTRQPNDRLLLGLKGTMSEAELGWIRQRAQQGLLSKARRGELILGLPIGYVKAADGRIEKHPDARIREALEMVFRKFAELGSVRQVLLWLRQEALALPSLEQECGAGPVKWRLPVYSTIHKFLCNPIYAGVYAFGRTGTRTRVVDGRAHKTRGHRREREEWTVLLREHHEGYIDWDTYERNRRLIADNAQMKGVMVRGAAREGRSLLAGLLRCGRCGRKLHVAYSGNDGKVPRYSCRGAAINHGADRCISFGGLRVDAAVEGEVLRVLTPGAIEAALDSAQCAAGQTDEVVRALNLELEEARYQAARAERQYDAVEPENRLVADTLERRWNEALARVGELDCRLEQLKSERSRQPMPDRERLLALAQRFPETWSNPATDYRVKKRLVRLLIEEIIASAVAEQSIELVIHWKGGKHSILYVRKSRIGEHRHTTDREVVEVVRELARTLPDAQIARVLNRLGYRTGAGNTWVQLRVNSLRNHNGIAAFNPERDGDGVVTIGAAAQILEVSTAAVRKLIECGVLSARQPVPYAPWAISREQLADEPVRAAAQAIKLRRKLPQSIPAEQLNLIKSGT